MATTSQAYNPLTPTSTLDSSPSSTPTDNGSDPNDVDIFSLSGSPPLIVALLAIGLFTVAMLTVFVRRRISQTHGLVIQPLIINHIRRKSIVLGAKPVLWDMWARSAGSSDSGETGWDNIMPFAAVLTSPVQPIVPPHIRPIHSNGHSPSCALRDLMSAVRGFYSPVLPPPPAVPDEEEAVKLPSLDESLWEEGSSLQISVVIAMPARRVVRSEMSERDTRLEEAELREFCIGTKEVSWIDGG
ncbi:hypothetical protein BS17DRAFT_879142 [Gyrodon lividus]|nr:hypothetical protein BS17DRAFT_879142 [Gyrodon lividus]